MQVTTILKKLEQYFISQRSIAYTDLQDGLPLEDIEQKIKSHGLEFPPVIYELYGWKNGKNPSSKEIIKNSELFPWGVFQSIETQISTNEFRVSAGAWEGKYFPIFGTGGGDYTLINCNPQADEYGYLYYYSLPAFGDVLQLRYTSLEKLLSGVLACFEAGAYKFENGSLLTDDQKANQILVAYEEPYQEDEDDF